MEQLWSQPADRSDDEPCIYSLVHHSHPSDSEPCQHRVSGSQHSSAHTTGPRWGRKNYLLIFFFSPEENLWMADVNPNPLNNRKCPRPGGGGGGCYCLLARDLLQLSTLAGSRGATFLARGSVGLAWDGAVFETRHQVEWSCFCGQAPADSDWGAQTCDGREDYISATQHPSNSKQHKMQKSC